METLLFWVFGGLAVASSAGVVLSARSTLNAALSLAAALLSLAVLFVLLHAEFVGVLQVMISAGAIGVLFLLALLLLDRRGRRLGGERQPLLKLLAVVLAGAAALQLTALLRGPAPAWPEVEPGFGTVRRVGLSLFTDYLLAVEVAGVLLLAGMVASLVLARQRLD